MVLAVMIVFSFHFLPVQLHLLEIQNVGKSSIINALKRSRAVGVSSRPGSTASTQEVVLDRNVRLIDSPGVVFSDKSSLLGCVDADSLEDPIPPVEAILKRCDHSSLLMTYNIPNFPQEDVMVFLAMVAKSIGRVLKGGIPNKVAAARTVLRDWNSGKIPYYTPAPEDVSMDDKASSSLENAKIVSKLDKEIDFEKFDQDVMKGLKDRDELDFVQLKKQPRDSMDVDEAAKLWNGSDDDDGSDEEEEKEENEDVDDDEDAMEVDHTNITRAKLKDAEDYDFDDM